MDKKSLQTALEHSFKVLGPYSDKYRVDFRRYLFTLEILTTIPEVRKKKIIDIGTGIGIIPVALHQLGYHVVGLDYYIFPESGDAMFGINDIDRLKSIWQSHGVTILESDIYNADLATKVSSVDIVINEAMIEHLKDPKRFLERIKDLLTPGGHLILTTPNSATLLKRLRFLVGLSPNWPIESFFQAGEKFTGHWREYTGKELRYMCQTSGFEIVSYWNKNLLANFKRTNWRKNLRALIARLSWFIPGSREMHYILCRKK